MKGVMQVAWREIRERGRSKAYLLTSILTLLLVVGLILVPPLLEGGSDQYSVGLVGEGNDAIVDAAARLGTAGDQPGEPPSVEFSTTDFPTRDGATSALEQGEVDVVLVDGDEVIVETVGFGGSSLLGLLQQGAAALELERLIAEEGETATEVIEVMTSDPLTTSTLTGDDPDDQSKGVVAYAGLLLLYMAILLYGTWILTGVTEEKSNRVVEVLLSALQPWQLLGGKILGIGALGITQFVGTVVAALVAFRVSGVEIPQIDPVVIVNLILWFVIGFLVFAVMFGAAGSLASRMEDAQNVAFPMSMVAVIGFFISIAALDAPNGTAAMVGTFVPITAPFVVPVRVSLNAIPVWQFLVSLGVTLGSIVGLVVVGGRIYAGGLLRFGRRIGWREAWRGGVE